MPTVQSLGISGLPLDSLLTSLQNNENLALQAIQSHRTDAQARLSAYGKLQAAVTAFQAAAQAVKQTDSFGAIAVQSGSDAISAKATPAAIPGQYAIEVSQLATHQTLVYDGRADRTTAIGSGGTLEITSADGKTHSLNLSDTSLNGLLKTINANPDFGVNATLVNDGDPANPYRLLLTSRETGTLAAATQVSVTGNDDLQAFLGATINADATSDNAGLQVQAAQDAALTLNGIAITSHSNTVDNVIDGVTLTLAKTTSGTANLSLARDNGAASKSRHGLRLGLQQPATEAMRPQGDAGLAARLAQALTRSVQTSGLFYESHLVQLAAGQSSVQDLRQEPQGRIAAFPSQGSAFQGAASPSSLPDGGASATAQMAQAAQPSEPAQISQISGAAQGSLASQTSQAFQALQTSPAFPNFGAAQASQPSLPSQASQPPQASQSALLSLPGVAPETHLLVRQQLEALANQSLIWQGNAWPGAPMRWEVRHRDARDADPRDFDDSHWATQLNLSLPRLGDVQARLSLSGNQLVMRLTAPQSAPQLSSDLESLRARLLARGLRASQLSVASESPPSNPAFDAGLSTRIDSSADTGINTGIDDRTNIGTSNSINTNTSTNNTTDTGRPGNDSHDSAAS
ncbi:hypothetical protein CDEF62S_03909 [Castellaniella defragrans]